MNDSSNESALLGPRVGIFWGIEHRDAWLIAADATEINKAEPYGDFLTHPRGHYEVWEGWRRLGSVRLKKRGLPVQILATEYEALPRGRIVFELLSKAFIIYADMRLQKPSIIKQIVYRFGLDRQSYVVRSDAHYVS